MVNISQSKGDSLSLGSLVKISLISIECLEQDHKSIAN